jgi:hypothetical protein
MSYDGYHSICQQTHRECFLDVFGEHPAVYVVLCGDRRSRGIGVHVLVRVCHTSVLALFNNASNGIVCEGRFSFVWYACVFAIKLWWRCLIKALPILWLSAVIVFPFVRCACVFAFKTSWACLKAMPNLTLTAVDFIAFVCYGCLSFKCVA